MACIAVISPTHGQFHYKTIQPIASLLLLFYKNKEAMYFDLIAWEALNLLLFSSLNTVTLI